MQLVFVGAIGVILHAQLKPLLFDTPDYDDYGYRELSDSMSNNQEQDSQVAVNSEALNQAAVAVPAAVPATRKNQPFIPEVVVSKHAGNMLGNKKYLEGTRIGLFSRSGRASNYKPPPEEHCSLAEYNQLTADHDLMTDPLYIFFGKHTRVGRHFFTEFFNKLSKQNGFRFVDGEYKLATKRRYISHEKQILGMLQKINCSTPEVPLLFSDHHHWLNLTELNLPQPTYITFIRNPVEEFISEYYYCRFGTNERPAYRTPDCKSMSVKKLGMNPMECSKEYTKFIKNCVEPHPIQLVDRLCGSDSKCQMGDLSLSSHNFQRVMTIELTKQRILQNYMFIGVLDHMKESFLVLEKLLPRFFSNSLDVVNNIDVADYKNRTSANKRIRIEDLDSDTESG